MVGMFSLATAICTPIIMLTNMQLRIVLVTDAESQFCFGHYLSLRLTTTLVALATTSVISLSTGYDRQMAFVILIMGLAKSFDAISDIFHGLLQKHERMDYIAISKTIKGILSLLALSMLIWITKNIIWGLLGLTLIWLVILLAYDLPIAYSLLPFRVRANKDIWWRLLHLAFPLGIVMMLLSLKTSIPRYFIEHYLGREQLGYYSAMAYLVVAGNILVRALGQSAMPRLARHFAFGERQDFTKLLLQLIAVGTTLGLLSVFGVILFGPHILTILYRPDYAQYADILAWIMLAGAIGYLASFLGYGMSAMRQFRIQVLLFTAVVITTAATCYFLVKPLGLLGAAIAVMAGAGVNLLGALIIVIHAWAKQSPA